MKTNTTTTINTNLDRKHKFIVFATHSIPHDVVFTTNNYNEAKNYCYNELKHRTAKTSFFIEYNHPYRPNKTASLIQDDFCCTLTMIFNAFSENIKNQKPYHGYNKTFIDDNIIQWESQVLPTAHTLTYYHRKPTTDELLTAYKLKHLDPYTRAQKAVYCVLRAKIRDSGLKMYIDLQNSTKADKQTADEHTTFAKLEQAEAEAKTLKSTIKALEKTSKDIKATDEQRAKALAEIPTHSRALSHLKSTIQALTDTLAEESTFTERQDLLHVAYIQDHINSTAPATITAEHLALIGKTEEEAKSLTIDEWATLQAKANFSAICKAINKHISTLPNTQTFDKVTKKYIPQTKEQAEEWVTIYGGIGKEIKVHQPRKRTRNSECFATMEYHDTKTKKGFYKVMHYITTAPITYIEQYTNEEGKSTIDNLIKYRAESHEPNTQNISTADTHKAILQEVMRLNKNKTTKTQANFLSTFLSDKVERYGDRAKQYYLDHKQGAHTTAQAEKYAYKKRIEKTFKLMQIDNPTTQRTTLYKLSQRIKPRATTKSTAQPKAQPKADLLQWALSTKEEIYIHCRNAQKWTPNRGYNASYSALVWIDKPTEQSHQAEQITKVVKWYTSNQERHTITADEKRAEEQAERDNQALRLIYSERLTLYKALRDANQWNTNGTYKAIYSAFTFFDELTEQEQLKVTELRLYEQAQAKAKAKQLKSKSVTLEQWQKMSRAEKDQYIAEFTKQYA